MKNDIGAIVVSVIVTVGFTIAINVMMFLRIDFSTASGQAFLMLLTILGQQFAQVVNHWLAVARTPAPPVTP